MEPVNAPAIAPAKTPAKACTGAGGLSTASCPPSLPFRFNRSLVHLTGSLRGGTGGVGLGSVVVELALALELPMYPDALNNKFVALELIAWADFPPELFLDWVPAGDDVAEGTRLGGRAEA